MLETVKDYETSNSSTSDDLPLKSALKTGKQIKKTNKKKKKRIIEFAGDEQETCEFCKKEFKNKELISEHFSGDTKCALKHKLGVYRKNYDKLKNTSLLEIEERDEQIKDLKLKLATGGNDPKPIVNLMGIPPKLVEKLKNLLSEFIWPTKKLDDVDAHRYKTLFNNENDAFALFFKNFIENPPKDAKKTNSSAKVRKRTGIFIKNDFDQCGLVIKCNDQLFLDTSGIVMILLRNFYFNPHNIYKSS